MKQFMYFCCMFQISNEDFEKFKNGEHKAFERIFRHYYKPLLSFVVRHEVSKMDAEDIVIEVLHRLWTMRQDIQSVGALSSLLYTSARNQTLNLICDTTNRARILEKQEIEHTYDLQSLIIEEEVARILDAAISKLSKNNQRVIRASIEGKTLAEIAEEMNISINSVKTHKLRAIQALRNSLKQYPYIVFLIVSL